MRHDMLPSIVKTQYKMQANTLRYRSTRPGVFCKKDVLTNFAKFSGKTPVSLSLFCYQGPDVMKEVYFKTQPH